MRDNDVDHCAKRTFFTVRLLFLLERFAIMVVGQVADPGVHSGVGPGWVLEWNQEWIHGGPGAGPGAGTGSGMGIISGMDPETGQGGSSCGFRDGPRGGGVHEWIQGQGEGWIQRGIHRWVPGWVHGGCFFRGSVGPPLYGSFCFKVLEANSITSRFLRAAAREMCLCEKRLH